MTVCRAGESAWATSILCVSKAWLKEKVMNDKQVTSDKQLAGEACDEGFKIAVQQKVDVLFRLWLQAETAADKKKALQQFKNGLGICKDAYQVARQTIDAVFV